MICLFQLYQQQSFLTISCSLQMLQVYQSPVKSGAIFNHDPLIYVPSWYEFCVGFIYHISTCRVEDTRCSFGGAFSGYTVLDGKTGHRLYPFLRFSNVLYKWQTTAKSHNVLPSSNYCKFIDHVSSYYELCAWFVPPNQRTPIWKRAYTLSYFQSAWFARLSLREFWRSKRGNQKL